jgi:RNA polymerase sigma-70 factor (ECF subfamily)
MTDRADSQDGDSSLSTSLLCRVKQHDPEAWKRLVHLYTPLVYAWCRRSGLQEADAQEVGQEVFTAVAQGIGRFRRESQGDTFTGWLRVITRNKLHDFRRSLHPTVVAGGIDRLAAAPAPAEDVDLLESDAAALRQRCIEAIKCAFSPAHWDAFWRLTVEGQTAQEAGAALGLSENAVYLAKSRILRRFREEFAELFTE